MGSLLDFALLQLLSLLRSEQSRFECVRKIVYRSAKPRNNLAPRVFVLRNGSNRFFRFRNSEYARSFLPLYGLSSGTFMAA